MRTSCCELCGSKLNLEVHHKIPKVCGGTDDEDNLILVCGLCHYKLTPKKTLQRIGIEKKTKTGIGHRKGAYGRPRIQKPDNWDEVFALWKSGEITAVKAIELTGLKKTTFYSFVKRNDQ